MMGRKRLKVKRKELGHLRCTFEIFPRPHNIFQSELRYKDKVCVGSFPLYGSGEVMDEDTFIGWVQPYLCQMFRRLKEAIDDGK